MDPIGLECLEELRLQTLRSLSPAPDTALSWQRQVNVEKISRRSDGDVASAGMTFQTVLCSDMLQVSVGVAAQGLCLTGLRSQGSNLSSGSSTLRSNHGPNTKLVKPALKT